MREGRVGMNVRGGYMDDMDHISLGQGRGATLGVKG